MVLETDLKLHFVIDCEAINLKMSSKLLFASQTRNCFLESLSILPFLNNENVSLEASVGV